jgi:hypothetical protein
MCLAAEQTETLLVGNLDAIGPAADHPVTLKIETSPFGKCLVPRRDF